MPTVDSNTRVKVRRERDAAVRRSLGLNSTSHVRRVPASKSRRWTEADIRRAVRSLMGGGSFSRYAYKAKRRDEDPNLYPSHNTVLARCPDLFNS